MCTSRPLIGLALLAALGCGRPEVAPERRADFDLALAREAVAAPVAFPVPAGAARAGLALPALPGGLGRIEVEVARPLDGALAVELERGDGIRDALTATPAFPGSNRYLLDASRGHVRLWITPPEAAALVVALKLWEPAAAELTRAGATRSCLPALSLRIANVHLGEGWKVRLGLARRSLVKDREPAGDAGLVARWEHGRSRVERRFPLAPGADWQNLWLESDDAAGSGTLELTGELPAGEELCFERPAAAPPPPPSAANVVLVSIDTLRADALASAPNLSARAARGRSFTRSYALSNWTLPSHAGLLLSRGYLEHGLPLPGEDQAFAYPEGRLPAAWTTVAEAFRAAGYATFASTEGGYLDPKFGFAQGFEAYSVVPALTMDREARLETHLERIAAFLREQRGGRPFFLFLHTYRAHDYLLNSAEYHDLLAREDARFAALGDLGRRQGDFTGIPAKYLRKLYRGGVARTDRFLEQALDGVEGALGPRDRLLVAITSDHGESFGEEPGVWGHGTSLREEQIRVPLVFAANDGSVPPGTDDTPVSALDVAPSLLAWAGLERPESFRGRALLASDGAERSPVEAMSAHLSGSFAERSLAFARVTGGAKLERRDRADGATALERCRAATGAAEGPDLALAACAQERGRLAERLAAASEWVWVVTARRPGDYRIDLDLATARLAAAIAPTGSPRPLLDVASGRVAFTAREPGVALLLFARADRLPVAALAGEGGGLDGPEWPAAPGARAEYSDAAGVALEVVRRSPGAPAGGGARPAAELERLERELRALGYLR